MTRKNAQIVLVAAALMGVAGAVAGQETEELVRTIPMEPGGRLTLRNVEGGITVTGVDGDDLTIRATKRASRRGGDDDALARVEIEIEERGNRVIVETDYPGHRRSLLESLGDLLGGGRRERREPFVAVDYRVAMPRGAGVTIESFAGDVTVEAVDGETRVETVSGDVRLTSLARLVAVESFSGDLELTDVRARDALTARTVGGRIDIEEVRTPRLEVKSFSGAVALRGRSRGDSKVETVSGAVTFDGVLAADDIEKVRAPRLEVKSFSGAVALRGRSRGDSKVETVSGAVTFDGVLAAEGRLGIRSHSGSIFLTVPDGSGFELEAESFSGSLRSDLPVLAGPGDPTRRATVLGAGSRAIRGTAGGRGSSLELFTVSGDIAISKGGSSQ